MSAYRSDFLVAPPEEAPRFIGPTAAPGEHWVYYHLAADSSVLYIGKTCQPEGRTQGHERDSHWFAEIDRFIWFGPLDEVNAAAVERELIGVEQPPNNIRHTNNLASPQARLNAASRKVTRLENELQAARRQVIRAEKAVARIASRPQREQSA